MHNKVYRKKTSSIKFFVYLFLLIFVVVSTFFVNQFLGVDKVSVQFLDEERGNNELKSYVELEIRNNASTFLDFILLDEEVITKLVHDEHQIVSEVKIAKDYKLGVNAVVKKNEEFFFTCVPEEYGFLVSCMMGNVDGVYYQEISSPSEDDLEIGVSLKALYDSKLIKKIESPDSLSGARILIKQEFNVLREVIKYLENNGYVIKRAHVGDLKIAEIFTETYSIKINLSGGYAQFVKDFELISRTGALQKYINDKKDELEYIDLSFKNKVFYRLKSEIKGQDIQGATTTKDTATTTEMLEISI